MTDRDTARFRMTAMGHVLELRASPLFTGLRAEDLIPIAAVAETASFRADESLFEQGDQGDRLYLVTHGAIEVSRDGQVLAQLGEGDCVGEMALLDDTTRSATVVAVQDTRVLTVTREDFHDLLDLYPGIARQIAAVMVERLRAAVDALDD